MINDNSLGERLNAVKNGNPIPNPPMQPNVPQSQQTYQPQMSFWSFLLGKLMQLSGVLFASFLYGFGIKTIFSLDWNILGALAVGFILNHAITTWPRIIKDTFRKRK